MSYFPHMTPLFRKTPSAPDTVTARASAFAYLPADVCYMDAACQTPRVADVIEAEREYVLQHNACGGRVKYKWGRWVDERVQKARTNILRLAGKSQDEYAVAFTLNTTYGINLVLHQLPADRFDRIVTSEIEHNSVFLPTMTWAKQHGKERLVLPRTEDGALSYDKAQLSKAVVLLNNASNIDGRGLQNARELAEDVHASGGILLIDAAQSFGHDPRSLRDIDFDAAFGSGHKMYGPSIGFIVIKRTLLRSLKPIFIGGGTVRDVLEDSFTPLADDEEQAVLEPGLQSWSGIVGLNAALEWLINQDPAAQEYPLAEDLFARVKEMPKVTVVNAKPSSILSFFVEGLDAHRLALYLDEKNVMCRSGHFCCHYYLQHVRDLPPLVRASMGLHTTQGDVETFVRTLAAALRAV